LKTTLKYLRFAALAATLLLPLNPVEEVFL